MSEVVSVEKDDGIAIVTIDNPPVNIIDSSVLTALDEVLTRLEADPFCRAVVLRGAGEKGFSAGASVAEHLPDAAPAMIGQMTALLERMHSTPLVTVAALHGICLGGGAEVALAADFVIAAEGSRIGIPEITLGCYPPFAMVQLPTLVGMRKAKEMVLTGSAVKSEEAEQIGLVNRVVANDDLMEESKKLLRRVLRNPPRIVAMTIVRMRSLEPLLSDQGHRRMGEAFLSDLLTHPDYNEGMNSFLEKRTPQWKGKRFCDGGCNND